MRVVLVALGLTVASTCLAAPLEATWTREQLQGGAWVDAGEQFAPDADGVVTVTRGAPFHARLATTVAADLAATPALRVDALAANAQWRLTAQADDGPELVVLDRQVAGVAACDLAELLGVRGPATVTLRLHLWGWGDGRGHYVRFRPELIATPGSCSARWRSRTRAWPDAPRSCSSAHRATRACASPPITASTGASSPPSTRSTPNR